MINPCEYEAYCSGSSLNMKICKQYIKSLTTPYVQFKVKSQHFNIFQSLHKFHSVILNSLLSLELKTDSCVQFYASSFVKARKHNIFEKWYHQYFYKEACAIAIMPDIDNGKHLMGDWALYASSEGKINKLEKLQVIGLGTMIIHQFEKYMPKMEKNTEILIEEKDFNMNYKVSLRYDIKFKIVLLSGIGRDKGTNLKQIFMGFQGGSNSTVLISILVFRLEMLIKSGLVPTLTSWEMFNIMSPDYILPLLTIGTIGKSKQVLNI